MSWTIFVSEYGLFILKLITLILIGLAVFWGIFSLKNSSHDGELVLSDLGEKYQDDVKKLKEFHLDEKILKENKKLEKKAEKKRLKEQKKTKEMPMRQPHLFVLDFKGDIAASQTTALREEISTIIAVAQPGDEVLLRLESPGGMVTGYGLAASQLMRLKQHQIPLTVAVDKVAASGGYMMACVADKIVVAPFAILGSIGVVAQVPNIHRLLKKHDVDVDVMTAGEYKRTVTMLGENTEKGKEKFQQELNETHTLFKNFVAENRPVVDINTVATGEHWFGQQAIALHLADEIKTSDDLLLEVFKNADKKVIGVKYQTKKGLLQKMGKQVEDTGVNLVGKLWSKQRQDFIS